MKNCVVVLGWTGQQVIVIDDDLAITGSGHADRQKFSRLLKMITEQQIGLVAGLEMSRLARNSKD